MKLSDYDDFPTVLPIVVEDELFFYPFMISPIFLSMKSDIDAATMAMENNSLLFVTTTQPGKEGKREYDSLYLVGVIGSVMRKVSIPDGRVKILFQGMVRGKLVEPAGDKPLKGVIEIIENSKFDKTKVSAILNILRDSIRKLSQLNSSIPNDLIKTIEENDEPHRIADLVSSMLPLKKEKAYELYTKTDIEERLLGLIDVIKNHIEALKIQRADK